MREQLAAIAALHCRHPVYPMLTRGLQSPQSDQDSHWRSLINCPSPASPGEEKDLAKLSVDCHSGNGPFSNCRESLLLS